MRSFFIGVTRNLISLLGVAITTASALVIVTLFVLQLIGFVGSPYLGILAYLVLPAIFVVGLVLIPIGILRERRRKRRADERGESPPGFPVLDLNVDRVRRIVLTVVLLTMVNLVLLATATYKGVEVMESTQFCGTTCHVMTPEITAHGRSPHASVRCVECHIGPGAGWFVKSKLSGAWQVVAVTFDLYPRPIPTPIENLRPARETCEQCHWPAKFVGDRLNVHVRYSEDESNTETKTVVLLKVGGIEGRQAKGIHWHVDPGVHIRYRSDRERLTIPEVELTRPDGTTTTFRTETDEGEGGAEWRVMDCVDCHNRPSHIYRMPRDEVDQAMRQGRLDRGLPFLRRESVRLLEQTYASQDEARLRLSEELSRYYRENHPEAMETRRASIDQAGAELGDIYSHNVFPAMAVGWGTYPDHIGHRDFPGCFRCHDGEHKSPDGEVISQDCTTCHTLLAVEEENPEILRLLEP